MKKDIYKKDWTFLQNLIWRVERAYQDVEEIARRLANGEEVLCDLSPTGALATLAQCAEESAEDAKPESPPLNPLVLRYDVAGLDDWNPLSIDPLRDLSRVVSILRKLVQWQDEGRGEYDNELDWLVLPFAFMSGDGPEIIVDGKVISATRSWFATQLVSRCREEGKTIRKLAKRVAVEKEASDRVEAAEKKSSDLKVISDQNIKDQVHAALEEHEREKQRKRRERGRKQGGQKKDDDKALDALRKQLAALAKKPECQRLTQKELIEKAVETVNESQDRLHCHWENYRHLLPPSRKRSQRKK